MIAAGPLVGCLWRGQAAPPGRASHRGAGRAQGPAYVCPCPGAGGRMSNLSAGQASMLALRLRLLLAAICLSDDERIQPQSSQRTYRDILSRYIGDIWTDCSRSKYQPLTYSRQIFLSYEKIAKSTHITHRCCIYLLRSYVPKKGLKADRPSLDLGVASHLRCRIKSSSSCRCAVC
jgi:hypothetical protein